MVNRKQNRILPGKVALLLFPLLCILCWQGCGSEDENASASLEISKTELFFSKDTSRFVLTFSNPGGEIMEWRVYNKPDWIFVQPELGDVPGGDSRSVLVACDLSLGDGVWSDSIEIRSDAGNEMIYVEMTVDIAAPPSGLYSGNTVEDLPISFLLNYGIMQDFNGSFLVNGQVQTQTMPNFGTIIYSDTSFTVTSVYGDTIVAAYDSVSTINGSWQRPDLNTYTFSVEIESE